MNSGPNWDQLISELLGKANTEIEIQLALKNYRIELGLSLPELSEITEISEDILETFEAGEQIDRVDKLKIFMYFLKEKQESIVEDDLKAKFELAYLLCKLALSENEEQLERLIELARSLRKDLES